MKILLIGFFALLAWSAVATHFFVCKIKGLCNEPETIGNSLFKQENDADTDTLKKNLLNEVMPGKLSVYFEFDRSEFKSDSLTYKYFVESDNYLEKNSPDSLLITGFTDAVGSDEYNQALGYRRARTMQNYFVKMGIPEHRILIASKGEKEPADINTSAAGRAHNRRTVITIKN
jgi:outer membrane protein OmpA-like peptidoglycan-associated protein